MDLAWNTACIFNELERKKHPSSCIRRKISVAHDGDQDDAN